MSINKLLLIGIGVIVLLLIIKKAKANALNNANAGNTNAITTDTVLQKGDKGVMVQSLQTEINNKLPTAYTKLVVDGIFGENTVAALQYLFGDGVKKASVNMVINTPVSS